MLDKELTAAFDAAYEEYTSVPFRAPIDRNAAKFFFLTGSRYGVQTAKTILCGIAQPESEVEGCPV